MVHVLPQARVWVRGHKVLVRDVAELAAHRAAELAAAIGPHAEGGDVGAAAGAADDCTGCSAVDEGHGLAKVGVGAHSHRERDVPARLERSRRCTHTTDPF